MITAISTLDRLSNEEHKDMDYFFRLCPLNSCLLYTSILIAASAAVTFTSCSLLAKSSTVGEEDYGSYAYHIAIISDETDSSFWKDVYQGAVEAGERYGAYVEQTGDGLVNQLSMEDAIDIAIYENVDGILLRPAEGEKIQKMIDKACNHGIPVITMQKDVARCV